MNLNFLHVRCFKTLLSLAEWHKCIILVLSSKDIHFALKKCRISFVNRAPEIWKSGFLRQFTKFFVTFNFLTFRSIFIRI